MNFVRARRTISPYRPSGPMICRSLADMMTSPPDSGAVRRRAPGRPQHIISTLNPALIRASDYLDLSQRRNLSVNFSHLRMGSILTYSGSRSIFKWIPFPEHSAGFLYYHHDPHTTPLEGGIRLRVTSDRAPSSFNRGRDLLLPSGSPWQIIMPQLACCKTYTTIRDRLLDESLVTPAELERCRALFADGRRLTPSLIIFRFNQEFPVNFSAQLITLTAVGEVLHTIKIGSVFTTTLDDVLIFPWTGSALVHFEPSTLPKYAGRRVIHMRIVKMVNPVACTVQNYKGRILRPEEGELLTISLRGGPSEPWAYDIDCKTKLAAGLRALWDATSIP